MHRLRGQHLRACLVAEAQRRGVRQSTATGGVRKAATGTVAMGAGQGRVAMLLQRQGLDWGVRLRETAHLKAIKEGSKALGAAAVLLAISRQGWAELDRPARAAEQAWLGHHQ